MLPNLIIIGAMKSATSSLHYYLNCHPEIFMSNPKELNYFVKERNWAKGSEWYKSHFDSDKVVRGESSTHYSYCQKHRGVPKRIYNMVPDVKLIYVLRDPIERTLSQYRQTTLMGSEKRTISEALSNLTDNDYILISMYHEQIMAYMEYFDKSKLLIVTMEELMMRQQETLTKVFRFLEVDETFYCKEYAQVLNRSVDKMARNTLGRFLNRAPFKKRLRSLASPWIVRAYSNMTTDKPPPEKSSVISPELRQRIADVLKDDVIRLRKYSGLTFDDWSL